ncbi:MAG: type II CAAX endopeptidase family protein [Deferribacterota bacterium]|nr:type II CAAX endopeptidase family protein [Deferribacterota bacterium]
MHSVSFRKNNITILLIGVLLATLGWYFAFGVYVGVFWYKLAITIIAVSLFALFFIKVSLKINYKSLIEGVISAAILYFIFYIGNLVAPYIVGQSAAQVNMIYSLGEGTNKLFVFLLLFFITSPGEELFWRAFLQGGLTKHIGDKKALVVSSLIYGFVHIFSLNLMLILSALVAGFFWGLQYYLRKDITANIISHAIFSSFIFAVVPIS